MRNVLITGATSGIGLATAKAMNQAGWHVIGTGLPGEDASALAAIGENITVLEMDISNRQSVYAAQAELQAMLDGHLHAVVNNAGITAAGAILELPVDELRRQFEVNVFGHVQVLQAMQTLLSNDARIVNVSSMMGGVSLPALGAYSMSKHALEALTDVLRIELANTNIQVVSVQMGAVATPLTNTIAERMEELAASEGGYAWLYKAMVKVLHQQSNGATKPEKVAKAIVHAVTSSKPKTRYIVGGAARGLMFMRQFSPDVIGDGILRHSLGLYPKTGD
ncbi:MAG: SDR family oxidoreductase [Anaerolineaceae bacterium]|nr:SDR family oxidoreductase [Anaerolineaceae bacterium]